MNWNLLTSIFGYIHCLADDNIINVSTEEVTIAAKSLHSSLINKDASEIEEKEWLSITAQMYKDLDWEDIENSKDEIFFRYKIEFF